MKHTITRKIQIGIILLFSLGLFVSGTTLHTAKVSAASTVSLQVSGMNATVSNGIYTLKFDRTGTGYSLVWNGKELIGPANGFTIGDTTSKGEGSFSPTQLKVVTNTSTMVDIAYIGKWGELHYVVRSGISGMYSYFVSTGIGTVDEFRMLYRVDENIFRTGYTGTRSLAFPTQSQIQKAKVIQDSTYKLANGTIYTKYDSATYLQQDDVYGTYGNGYGVWLISPSHEYLAGGPLRQDLTTHIDASTGDSIVLNMLVSQHFGTPSMAIPSGKIYGPWLVYFNNGSIPDAQSQDNTELAAWPYSWLSNPHYPLARTTVNGTLNLANGLPAAGATVTLAAPGGNIYNQGTGYIFSTQADSNGSFSIPNVRPGSYSLYAFANGGATTGGAIGSVTDQYERDNLNVSGSTMDLGTLTWSPTHYANYLWQIGTSDHKADEFKLGNIPRQYGLFNQVPKNLTYTIGQSTPANNWYYAQTQVGTWIVNFNLSKQYTGNAHLTIALAGETRNPSFTVSANGHTAGKFPSNTNDDSIYRSANQSGIYHKFTLNFSASFLKAGANTLTFRANSVSSGSGVMYDTVKLETD